MERAYETAGEFLRRLENDGLRKEHLPNQGFEVTKEVVEEELKKYDEFLRSDFFKELCRE